MHTYAQPIVGWYLEFFTCKLRKKSVVPLYEPINQPTNPTQPNPTQPTIHYLNCIYDK